MVPELFTIGGKASGVPGTVAGLLAAHKKYGRLKLEQVMQPAIDLARIEYVVYASLAKDLQENR
jgi:gamma-glutamyltranspeptidase/glutathione hydrolase